MKALYIFIFLCLSVPVFGQESSSTQQVGRTADQKPDPAHMQGPILPEVTTPVLMSASDINRINCPSPIQDLLYSLEKPIEGKFVGNNAFIKFKTSVNSAGYEDYTSQPQAIHITCGDNVYSIVAYPKSGLKTVTLHLQGDLTEQIKENQSTFAALPMKKKYLRLIKEAYHGEEPPGYTIRRRNDIVDISKDLIVTVIREMRVPGEGIGLLELSVRGNFRANGPTKLVLDKDVFLTTRIHDHIRSITIVDSELEPKSSTRVFVGIHYGG